MKYALLLQVIGLYLVLPVLPACKTTATTTPDAASTSPTNAWTYGTWQGIGYQIDGANWPMELRHRVGEAAPLVDYPSLSCSGDWRVVKATPTRIDYVERITEGTSNCDLGVRIIVLKVDANQIAVVFKLPSYGDKAIAHALLTREPDKNM